MRPLRRPRSRSGALHAERDALAEEAADLRRTVEELRVLNEVAQALGKAEDLDDVLHTLVRHALRAVGAEQGVLALVDAQEGKAAEARTLVRTHAAATAREALRPNEAVLGWMHHEMHPLLVHDPAADPRFQGVAWPPTLRSLLAVPMLVGGRLLGVLSLYNKRAPGNGNRAAFSEDDARLLAILAAQSALVVERTRLVEERAAEESRRREAEAERDRLLHAFGQTAAPAVAEAIRQEGTEGLQARFGFTKQEARVALLLAERKTNQEVADALFISPSTARGHTERVLEKLGVATRRAVADALGGVSEG
jgi:GAF domain-containing protein